MPTRNIIMTKNLIALTFLPTSKAANCCARSALWSVEISSLSISQNPFLRNDLYPANICSPFWWPKSEICYIVILTKIWIMIIYFDDLTLQIWTASELEAHNYKKLQTRILDNVKLGCLRPGPKWLKRRKIFFLNEWWESESAFWKQSTHNGWEIFMKSESEDSKCRAVVGSTRTSME